MNTDGRPRPEQPGVANSVTELTHNAIELAELQAKLFSLDMKETSQNAGISIGLVIASVCILLGSIPVLLIALALALVDLLNWPPAACYAIAGVVGILISACIAAAAWTLFRSGIAMMKRSRDELNRNIAWLKSNLRSRGRSGPIATE